MRPSLKFKVLSQSMEKFLNAKRVPIGRVRTYWRTYPMWKVTSDLDLELANLSFELSVGVDH